MKVDGDQITVSVAASKGPVTAHGEVWICSVSKAVPISIERGENRGHTIVYHNVVRRWLKVGNWTGKAETWTVPMADLSKDRNGAPIDDIDSIAVLVQSGAATAPGAMLGAAMMPRH
jgi:hypothetical protein